MKAVILVGGFGTRLRPLTLSMPKPLIPFANKPIIKHQIEALVAAGVREVILAVGYGQDKLREELKGYGPELGIQIEFSVENKPMGTAGPLSLLREKLTEDTEPFFVLNSDVICQFPLRDMLHFHRQHRLEGTMLVTRTSDPSSYGVVIVSENTPRIESFVEKPKQFVGDRINAGIYILNPEVFEYIEDRPMSLERDVFPQMAVNKLLCAFELTGFWMDIGQPKDYIEANNLYLREKKIEHKGDHCFGSVLIDPTAIIGTGCLIGPGVTIGPRVVIGDGVRICNAIIFEGAVIGSFSVIKSSIVGWRSELMRWARVEGYSVLGAEVEIGEGIYINGGVVLPNKSINSNISSPQIVM